MKSALLTILALCVITVSAVVFMDTGSAKDSTITLSDESTVSLNLPITDATVSEVQARLMEEDQLLNRSVPIYLVLNSPGGSIDAGIRLIETVKGLGRRVHTISLFSASMSFVISQYLDNRYVLTSSTLMAHRAYLGGVEGFLPGSFLARTLSALRQVENISNDIAKRANLDPRAYRNLIANELWMGGQQAVDMKFADKVVNIKCDKSLLGYSPPEQYTFFGVTFTVEFPKCPLVTQPKVSVSTGDSSVIRMMLGDRHTFVNRFNTQLEQ